MTNATANAAFARNVGRRATFQMMQAPLREAFARDLLVRRFGERAAEDILSAFGQISKGPRKGQQRGHLHWVKCEAGGWAKFDGFSGVLRPGSQRYCVTLNGAPALGNIRACGSSGVPGEKYREYVRCALASLCPKAKQRLSTAESPS